jgi:hypothetical protein
MDLKLTLILSITLELIWIYPSRAQQPYDAGRLFSIGSLREDFTTLRNVLQEAHIGLYRYVSKETMDSLMDAQFNKIDHPMTEIDFYKIVNPVMCAIRDEHTFALPSAEYWNNEIGQTVYTGNTSSSKAKLFPFFIKVIDNRLFIDNNLSSDPSIPDGTEILSVNGKQSAILIKSLLPTLPTNGFIETFRSRNLEQFSLQQTYNRFIVHYAIFIGRPDTFNIVIQKPGTTQVERTTLPALPSKDIYNHYWRRYSAVNDVKKRIENPVEFKLLTPKTAYLRLSDFHEAPWRKYNLSHSTEYRNDFNYIKMKGIEAFIIDLRGNEGGNLGMGVELLQYIFTGPFRIYDYHECKNYRFPAFKKYMRYPEAMERLPDSVFVRTNENTFRSDPQVKTESWSRPMQPIPDPYRNKLYVLINGATGSAASMFATIVRVNRKDAIFIGEESGGDIEGPVSGEGMDIMLPNTRIRADIPFIRRVVNLNGYTHKKGRGIIPDHVIATSIHDFVNKEDTQLRYTLDLIEK